VGGGIQPAGGQEEHDEARRQVGDDVQGATAARRRQEEQHDGRSRQETLHRLHPPLAPGAEAL